MEQTDLSTLSNAELLAEVKKLRSSAITNAVFIGFLLGIVVYSVFKQQLWIFNAHSVVHHIQISERS